MAVKFPLADGLWSNAANWNGGTKPVPGDNVYADGHTVTIDEDIDVAQLRVDNDETGGTDGGGFLVSSGARVLACRLRMENISSVDLPVSGLLRANGSASVTVVGDVDYENVGSGDNGSAIYWDSTGELNIVGIVDNESGRNNLQTIYLATTPSSFTITGELKGPQAGSSSRTIRSAVQFDLDVIGNVEGGGGNSNMIYGNAVGQINVIGNFSAQKAGTFYIPNIDLKVTGNVIFPATGGNILYTIGGFFLDGSCTLQAPSGSGTTTLYSADLLSGMPAASDVRDGTIFGPSSELTGTCAIPPAAAVGVGVPVDDTVGSAAVTAQAIADAVGQLIAGYGGA